MARCCFSVGHNTLNMRCAKRCGFCEDMVVEWMGDFLKEARASFGMGAMFIPGALVRVARRDVGSSSLRSEFVVNG